MFTPNLFFRRIFFFVCYLICYQLTYAQVCNLPPGLNYNSSNTLCEGSDITFSITVPNLPSGCIVDEYRLNTPLSGTVYPSSPTYTVLGAIAGSYSATYTIMDDGSSTCPCTGSTAAATSNIITIDPIPNSPTISGNGTACLGEQLILGAQTSSPPTGSYQFYWYSATNSSGPPYSPSGPVLYQGQSYTTPPISGGASYYVTIKSGACESAATQHVIVPVSVTTPILLASNPTTTCLGNTVQLGIDANLLDSNEVAYWYADAGGNNLLHIGNLFTSPPLTTATTFYVQIVNHVHSCKSSIVSVNTINIQTMAAPPSPTITNDCIGGQATLSSTPTQLGGALYWYSDLNGQPNHLLGIGNTFMSNTLNGGITYHVQEVTSNGCNSPSTTITLDANSLPSSPGIISNTPLCEGQNLTLELGNVQTGLNYSWQGPNIFNSNLQQDTVQNVNKVQHQGNYFLTIQDNSTGCINIDTFPVFIYPQPMTPTITGDHTICNDDSLVLMATPINNASYIWSYPNSSAGSLSTTNTLEAILDTSNQGTVSVIAVVNACSSEVASQSIQIHSHPIASATSNSPICEGNILDINAIAFDDALYFWSDAMNYTSTQQSNQIIALPQGQKSYILKVTKNGCSSYDTLSIQVNGRPSLGQFSIPNPYKVCEETSINLSVGIANSLDGNWNGPNSFFSTEKDTIISQSIANIHTGNYTFQVTESATKCSSDTTISVLVTQKPQSPILENSGPVCEGEQLEVFVQGANPHIDYTWIGPKGNIFKGSDTLILAASIDDIGQYNVNSMLHGCSSETSMMSVNIRPNPILTISEDQIDIEEGNEFRLEASGATFYEWFDGSSIFDILNPFSAVAEIAPINLKGQSNNSPYQLSVTGTNAEGCSSTKVIEINILNRSGVVVYNTFTPNGDGMNETFSIDFIENLETEGYEVKIFDKSGVVVWATNDYSSQPWDGTYQRSSQEAPTGAYYYWIKSESFEQKGGIMLLRNN